MLNIAGMLKPLLENQCDPIGGFGQSTPYRMANHTKDENKDGAVGCGRSIEPRIPM
jgi:hypothetical protein